MGFKLPTLPDTITDPAVKDLLEKYYETSNNPIEHDEFASLFTSDGEYAMNGKASKGKDSEFHEPLCNPNPLQILRETLKYPRVSQSYFLACP